MKRIFSTLCVALTAAAPALADGGLHHHPHGVTYGWIIAAVLLTLVPVAAVALKRIEK